MTTWKTRADDRAGVDILSFGVRPLAVLLLAAVLLSGAASARASAPEPSPAAAAAVGTWRSHRPAGKNFEVSLTLRLLADGTAELTTATGDGSSFGEKGTWRLQGGLIKVLVFEVGRPPSPNEMLLEPRGETLVPVRWAAEFYGESPLGKFVRLPDEKPAR